MDKPLPTLEEQQEFLTEELFQAIASLKQDYGNSKQMKKEIKRIKSLDKQRKEINNLLATMK